MVKYLTKITSTTLLAGSVLCVPLLAVSATLSGTKPMSNEVKLVQYGSEKKVPNNLPQTRIEPGNGMSDSQIHQQIENQRQLHNGTIQQPVQQKL